MGKGILKRSLSFISKMISKSLVPILFLCAVYAALFLSIPTTYWEDSSNSLPNLFTGHQFIFSPEEQETLEHSFPHSAHPLLIAYIRQRLLVAPSPGPRSMTYVNKSRSSDLSQTGISGFIDEILQSRQYGFYVDCGAYDGNLLSKTIFFETQRSWLGLLIEPHPVEFTNLLLRHRNAYAVNVAASPTATSGKFYFSLDGITSGLATFPNTVLHRLAPPVSIVQAFTLFSLILATNRTHVDYLALNVAGAEVEILQTIPFSLLTFDVISVGYRRQHDHLLIDEHESRTQLTRVRKFFKQFPQYKEAGIAPVVDKNNKTMSEGNGYDVIYVRDVLFNQSQ